MAMLVMNRVFARTWLEPTGAVPGADYWTEVIPQVRFSNSEFLFIAEAYWDLEGALLEQGFDACYDKAFYDQLAHGSAESLHNHLVRLARPKIGSTIH